MHSELSRRHNFKSSEFVNKFLLDLNWKTIGKSHCHDHISAQYWSWSEADAKISVCRRTEMAADFTNNYMTRSAGLATVSHCLRLALGKWLVGGGRLYVPILHRQVRLDIPIWSPRLHTARNITAFWQSPLVAFVRLHSLSIESQRERVSKKKGKKGGGNHISKLLILTVLIFKMLEYGKK